MEATEYPENNSNYFFQKFRYYCLRVFRILAITDIIGLLIIALFVGFLAGIGSIVFWLMITYFRELFFNIPRQANFYAEVLKLPWYQRIAAPALGGLVIGPLLAYVVREARSHSVPDILEAVELRDGKIRPMVVPLKILISSICIGAGGSAGRVDPLVVMGGGVGSAAGQFFNLDEEQIKTLLASGVAGGLAGTFNAPIAGAIYSEEIILKEFRIRYFSPIVVSSVVATSVSRLYWGSSPFFPGLDFTMASYWEFIAYVLFGLLAGILALTFTNMLGFSIRTFKSLRLPYYLKPALGGLIVGLLAYFIPQVYGSGGPVIQKPLVGEVLIPVALVLLVAKIVATSLFLGSGGSGGIFAPTLFAGAMAGSSFGQFCATLFPNITAGSSSYAIVGMGALFAGVAHAPLTAIIFIFELTRDYQIMLPLMLACIISTVLAEQLQKTNIYTIDLADRGVDIHSDQQQVLLNSIEVREAMSKSIVSIESTATLSRLHSLISETYHTHYPVVDPDSGEISGVLSYNRILDSFGIDENLIIARDMADPPVIINPADSLQKAYDLISKENIALLCVVSPGDGKELIGVLNRSDIIDVYHRRLSEHSLQFNLPPLPHR